MSAQGKGKDEPKSAEKAQTPPAEQPKSGEQAKSAAEKAAEERRKFERSLIDATAHVTEIGESGIPGPPWECRIADISRGGMGLRSRRMVHEGRVIFVTLNVGPDKPPRVLCGMVRQTRYLEGQEYVVGLMFCAPPRSKAVKKWLSQFGLTEDLASEARAD